MNQFYNRLGASDRLKVLFQEFQSQSLKFATFDLTGTMSLQSLDIEDSGQLVFDFVELEAQTDHPDFIDFLSQLSCSLKDTYYHA